MSDMSHFLRNLPWWIWDVFLSVEFTELARRIWRKSRKIGKWLKNVISSRALQPIGTDLEDFFELKSIPDEYLQMLNYHLDLLRKYQPFPYSGPLTLYRARAQSLFRTMGRDLNWGKLVNGPVELVQISGNHDNIIKEPRIRQLAEALRTAMARVETDRPRYIPDNTQHTKDQTRFSKW